MVIDTIVQKAARDAYWGDLATTIGLPREVGLSAGRSASHLSNGLNDAGFSWDEPDLGTDRWRATVAHRDDLTNAKLSLDMFARESDKHAFLAGAVVDAVLSNHSAAELFRPEGAPSVADTARGVEELEKIMRVQGLGVLKDDPALGQWLPKGLNVGTVREELATLGLNEREQTAALILGGEVRSGVRQIEEDSVLVAETSLPDRLADMLAFGEQSPDRLVAASHMLNLAGVVGEDYRDNALRPEWAFGPKATEDMLTLRLEAQRADQDKTIEPDEGRQKEDEELIKPRGAEAPEADPQAKEKPEAEAEKERATDTQEPPTNEPQAGPQAEATLNAGGAKREDYSVEAGDVPDSVRNKYLLETNPLNKREISFHTDAQSKEPAFKDKGAQLLTRQTSDAIVRDMVATAEHRGWSAIKVGGDKDFRRAVWLEAAQKGIEVTGYRPTDRDKQELEKLLDSRDGRTIEPDAARMKAAPEQTADRAPEQPRGQADGPTATAPPKPDYEAGVSGVLVGQGTGPYLHDKNNGQSSFVKLEMPSGQVIDVWGVGLPDAIDRAGVKVGDHITVRKEGVEMVQKPITVKDQATGEKRTQTQTVPRNQWEVTADKFRSSTPAEAARDSELKGAQSTVKLVETILNSHVADKGLREKLLDAVKEQVASKLEIGNQFKQHRVREQRLKDPTPENRRKETRVKAQGRAQVTRGDKAKQRETSAAQPRSEAKAEGKGHKGPERSRSR